MSWVSLLHREFLSKSVHTPAPVPTPWVGLGSTFHLGVGGQEVVCGILLLRLLLLGTMRSRRAGAKGRARSQ